jgi:hypothetical protein
MYVPDYPGAQNTQLLVQEDPQHTNWSANRPYKVVGFSTTDSADQVFAFFKEKLLARSFEDWRSNTVEQDAT